MADTIRYVDQAGLQSFLEKLKAAYASNTSTKFEVNYAKTAGKIAHTLTIKNSNNETILDAWDGSSDAVITVSSAAPAPVVEGVLKFKGTVTSEGFPQDYEGPEEGDVVVCTGDYTFESTSFKAGSEYLYDGNGWVELGSVVTPVDLTNYYTKDEADTAIGTAVDTAIAGLANTYLTQADAESTYAKKSELSGYVTTEKLAQDLAAYDAEVEQTYLKRADAASVYETKAHAEETFVAKVDYVTEPQISKMFPVDFVVEEGASQAQVTEAFAQAVNDLGDGGALNITDSVTTPTTGAYGMYIGTVEDPVDVTFNLSDGGALTASNNARVFSVQPGSKVEIIGDGTTSSVTCTADEPAIFIANNASVTIDGVTLEGKNYSVLQSNGLNEDSDFTIKNCTIYGPSYMPACGRLVIEDSTLVASDNTAADAGPLVVKSGSITIRNSHLVADTNNHPGVSGRWRHWNNGWYGIATALVIENCNYGGHGNITVDIDSASTFTAGYCDTTNADVTKQFDNVGILIINYNGETSDSIKIDQNYYTIDIEESTIKDHYFTFDGRSGAADQLTLVEYQG